jgi:hypothetical protein
VTHKGHRGYFFRETLVRNHAKYDKPSTKSLSLQLQSGIFAGARHVFSGDASSLLTPIDPAWSG